MKKRIVMIHDTEMMLDSRTQKEIKSLSDAGYSVCFLGWNKDKDSKFVDESIEHISDYQIPNNDICIKIEHRKGVKENLGKLIKYEFKASQWLFKNRKQYDVIHACNFDTAIAAEIVAKVCKKKVIYDIFDDYADCHVGGKMVYNTIKFLDRRVIKNANHTIICSEKRREQLAIVPEKLSVIHNSPDVEIINRDVEKIKLDEHRLNIIYVGNLTVKRFIPEMLNIVSRNSYMTLYVGGSGQYENEVKKYAKSYGNIVFLGRLKYNEVLAIEEKCDVIPALYDPSFKNHVYAAPNKFY